MKFFWIGLLLVGMAWGPAVDRESGSMKNGDRVLIYENAIPVEVHDPGTRDRIIGEALNLFTTADDIYLKAISSTDISRFRSGECVEIMFGAPRSLTVRAVNDTKQISRLLIPLDDTMCATHAHVIYGDPEYQSFNILLNSRGCAPLRALCVGTD